MIRASRRGWRWGRLVPHWPTHWFTSLARLRTEMARTLYCRWADCRFGYESQAGEMPPLCPHCERAAAWSTMAPEEGSPGTLYPGDPRKPYELNDKDKILLMALRITPD